MRNMLLSSILAAATLATLGAAPASADNITTAFAGRPQNPADAGCFREYFGTMQNTCATTKMLMIPFDVDEPGYHTVTVWAFGATPSNYVQCDAIGPLNNASPTFASYYESGWKGLSTFGTVEALTLNPTYVPGGGGLYVACQVSPQGQVNVTHVTP